METTEAPTTTDSPLAAHDPRLHLATAVGTARRAMAAVTPDQYQLPTPCPAMTVEGLLAHLVTVVDRIACAGRAVPPAEWPADRQDIPQGQWEPALLAAAHEVQAVWTDDVLDRPTAVPWGEFTGAEVAAVYVNELTVHTWDLARATGQEVAWDDAVLACSWEAIRSQLPDADRDPQWDAVRAMMPPGVPFDGPFANAVDVPDDAPPIDRLVAWNGRRP